jgi:hypothetical protein
MRSLEEQGHLNFEHKLLKENSDRERSDRKPRSKNFSRDQDSVNCQMEQGRILKYSLLGALEVPSRIYKKKIGLLEQYSLIM